MGAHPIDSFGPHQPSLSEESGLAIWTLEKDLQLAECTAIPHWAGRELLLTLDDEVIARKLVRNDADFHHVSTAWHWSMRRKGWN